MRTLYPTLSLAKISGLFGLTRQAVYSHIKLSYIKGFQNKLVLNLVDKIRVHHPKMGTRKLYNIMKPQLINWNINIGRDKLFNLLKVNGLLVKRKKRRYITTDSNHPYRKYENLIVDFIPYQANQLWVSDITYLKVEQQFYYLFLLTDAYSRKICGYKLSDNMEACNAVDCLQMGIDNANSTRGLIHHSDRGIQYCSHEYVKLLQDNKLRISMTQDGNPTDNSIAERINGILKQEYLFMEKYKNYEELKKEVDKAVYKYNELRPHLSCDMLTPLEAHSKIGKLNRKW